MIDRISYFSPRLRRFFEPDNVMLVRNGRIQHRNLRREYLSEAELMSKLREEGVDDVTRVKAADFEADG